MTECLLVHQVTLESSFREIWAISYGPYGMAHTMRARDDRGSPDRDRAQLKFFYFKQIVMSTTQPPFCSFREIIYSKSLRN